MSNLLQFFSGQVAQIALLWLITELTTSRTLLGTVGLAQGLTVFLASPAAGVAADRLPKRRLLAISRLSLALLPASVALLVFSERIEVWHVVVFSVLGGMVMALMQPASQTYVYDVVGRKRVQNAIALNATGTGAAQMGGPALAGGLIALVGTAATFGFSALGMAFSGLILVLIPVSGGTGAGTRRSVLADLREGFRYVADSPPLRIAFLICCLSIFNGALGVMRPIFARHVLEVGSQGYGLMAGAAGVGTVLGGVVTAVLPPMKRPGLVLAGSMLAFALSIALYSLAFSFSYILVVELLMGISGQVWGVATYSGLQMSVPEDMRGRVMGMVFMVVQLGSIGQLLIGLLADAVGDQLALGIFGLIPTVCIALLFAFGYRSLREL